MRAGSCALVEQAQLPSLLSSRLAALMEMETLACTVLVLPVLHKEEETVSQEAPTAPMHPESATDQPLQKTLHS